TSRSSAHPPSAPCRGTARGLPHFAPPLPARASMLRTSNRRGSFMKSPLLVRTLSICAVALAILVPILAIQGKVAERRSRAGEVAAQFARETSGDQSVVGPLLVLTCEEKGHEASPC